MGIVTIILKITGFLFGTKNVKGKAVAIWLGSASSMIVYPVLEAMGYIPSGFSSTVESFNLPDYFNYVIGILFLVWANKDNLKKWLHGFTKDGIRDAIIAEQKDILESKKLSLEITKVEIELMEAELEKKDLEKKL